MLVANIHDYFVSCQGELVSMILPFANLNINEYLVSSTKLRAQSHHGELKHINGVH